MPSIWKNSKVRYSLSPIISVIRSARHNVLAPPAIRYRTATAAWEEFFFPQLQKQSAAVLEEAPLRVGKVLLNLFPCRRAEAFAALLRFMGKLADGGINILIFPEGERSRDGRLLPFQLGLGIMVKEVGLPVVPVKIEGLERLFPRGSHWPKRGKVQVTFGRPMVFQREEADEIVAIARKAVAETLMQLCCPNSVKETAVPGWTN